MNKEELRKYSAKLLGEKEELQQRIDKAIEYIHHAQNYGTMAQVMSHLKPYVNGNDLLDILKGDDKE